MIHTIIKLLLFEELKHSPSDGLIMYVVRIAKVIKNCHIFNILSQILSRVNLWKHSPAFNLSLFIVCNYQSVYDDSHLFTQITIYPKTQL